MVELNETQRALLALTPQPEDANSLFLPLVPHRKFPPADSYGLPDAIVTRLVTNIAIEVFFPFEMGSAPGPISSRRDFHEFVTRMNGDPELVFTKPISLTVGENPSINASFKLEYCFSRHLLDRVVNGPFWHERAELPVFYHYLVDLVMQALVNERYLAFRRDEVGNYWCRLRGRTPYRTQSFYSDVTVLCTRIDNLIRVVWGEADQDVDSWYQYEWLSPIIKTFLASEAPSLPPSSKQARIMQSIFNKFSKFLTQEPR